MDLMVLSGPGISPNICRNPLLLIPWRHASFIHPPREIRFCACSRFTFNARHELCRSGTDRQLHHKIILSKTIYCTWFVPYIRLADLLSPLMASSDPLPAPRRSRSSSEEEEEEEAVAASQPAGDWDSGLDLGFVHASTPAWKLTSRFFPSKVGGPPAWLKLEDLPDVKARSCPMCQVPMTFLAQIYAPIHDIPTAFHRTLFLLVCATPTCHAGPKTGGRGPWTVFRSQLARANDYYPFEPPLSVQNPLIDISAANYGKLCRVCHGPGAKSCAGCQKVGYCCKSHQALDWSSGGHKQECGQPDFTPQARHSRAKYGFPEMEIEIEAAEAEDYPPTGDSSDDDDEAEEEAEEEASELAAQTQMKALALSGNPAVATDLTQLTSDQKTDPVFARFKATISHSPEQILRYERHGSPLWMASEDQWPLEQVPACEFCGQPRSFEFQIMPQLLHHLRLDQSLHQDSLDWGVLAVFTCSKSCSNDDNPAGPSYKKEFVHCQMPPQH
ncbi:hypothetical protein TCAL_16812 [Tigriopus californicus]|uniref:MYND-type domain-containing protein n=2 Tax=Tigriopus californicus TaxID=6832 RepID=A0A553PC03_TIGCA|nr:hypothetical protein TCAL_16812 [Tigriopus californicus]